MIIMVMLTMQVLRWGMPLVLTATNDYADMFGELNVCLEMMREDLLQGARQMF